MSSSVTTPPAGYSVWKGGLAIRLASGGYQKVIDALGNFVGPVASLPNSVQTTEKTVATTGATDSYVIVPKTGVLSSVDFSGISALAASDSNYITFTLTNLGQAGAGSTVLLAATDANTTKATGGAAIVANGKRSLTLTATSADLAVTAGDRLKLSATATGTLANTVTGSIALLRFADAA